MKSTLFSILAAFIFFAFTSNQSMYAQSKETKSTDNKVKTTVQRIDTKKDEVKQTAGTITHKQHKQLKGGINTTKSEVKMDAGKDMKKMSNEIKESKPLTNNKIEKSSDKKIKN